MHPYQQPLMYRHAVNVTPAQKRAAWRSAAMLGTGARLPTVPFMGRFGPGRPEPGAAGGRLQPLIRGARGGTPEYFRGGADDHVPASASPAPQETEPEELKENQPVTAQQGLSR